MPRNPLGADHSIGFAVLHADGSLTLKSGQKKFNESFKGRIGATRFEVVSDAGDTHIRLSDGRHYAYLATCWYEVTERRPESPAAQHAQLPNPASESEPLPPDAPAPADAGHQAADLAALLWSRLLRLGPKKLASRFVRGRSRAVCARCRWKPACSRSGGR